MSTPRRIPFRSEVRTIKRCACGLSFRAIAWLALPVVGTWTVGEVEVEQRNCPCGSTISLGRDRVRFARAVERRVAEDISSNGWEV